MVVTTLIAIRHKIASRVGKRLTGIEATCHLFYGTVVFTELHEGITLYSVAALGLGVASVLASLFGEDR